MKHIYDTQNPYFVTTNTFQNRPFFLEHKCCDILIKFLDYFRQVLEYYIYGYVIMPTHLHWIVHPLKNNNIAWIMKMLKGRTAHEINKFLGMPGQFWQSDYYEHVLRNYSDFKEKITYIHRNPIRAGLEANLGEYKYSSYRNYYLRDHSVIKIDDIGYVG